MAKYTITNAPNYILFNGIVGTEYEGESFAFRKSCVKQVRTEEEFDHIDLVHLDDYDSPFRYYDIINPATGSPFVSLAVCKELILNLLNDLSSSPDTFLGQWNAALNEPILANDGYWDGNNTGTPNVLALPRSFFIVTTAGAAYIDGTGNWAVGDYVKSTGSAWVKIPETDTIAAISVYLDPTEISDPIIAAAGNVQSAIKLLANNAVKELKDLSDVDDSLTPINRDILVYNGINSKWEREQIELGRVLFKAISILDGTNSTLPAYGNGLYLLDIGTTAVWVPVGAVVGDVLSRDNSTFTIYKALTGVSAGGYEIQFSAGKFINSNYIWDGTKWSAIDAYEPNAALYTVSVSNPLGDITSSSTALDLKSRSISSLLDDILFKTVYNKPIAPTLTLTAGANIERGANITGTATPTFTQNGGGAISTYSIQAVYGGSTVATQSGSGPSIPNVNLNDINGYDLKANPITNSLSQVVYTVNYANGPIPIDNKGVTYPADQILAGSKSATSSWTPRYPIWYDTKASAYGVVEGSLTDLSVAPTVVEGDVRALVNTSLFVSNGTFTNTIHAGDITVLVALPPGITMSNSELNVAGSWLDFSDLRTHSISVNILAADGTTAKSYTVYYARSKAADSFVTTQDYRFTTTGSVTV